MPNPASRESPAREPACAEPPALALRALLDPERLGHRADDARIVETHISWVLLAGDYAYKIRKPVALPFLDFTTLEARRVDCERELELNRRWAPQLYLDVLPIHGPARDPRWRGEGAPIEYAVRMRRFPDDARLDRVAGRGALDAALVDAVADAVAAMHEAAPIADARSGYGGPVRIRDEVTGNLVALEHWPRLEDRAALDAVREFSLATLDRLAPAFLERRAAGRVRECHGDLHLENLALVDGHVLPFDGVEFEPAFRWIDVASDLAFLLTDLRGRGHAPMAGRLLDRYLQHTGDYDALTVLRHYQVYRAMVRAKVAAVRADQGGGQAGDAAREAHRLLALARDLAAERTPAVLAITRGVSGSGKSWLAARLVEATGVVRVRSDVERTRLYPAPDGRYAPAATRTTYDRLAAVAATALGAGYPVLVDATFLDAAERARFADLAHRLGAQYRILDLVAPRAVLEQRVRERAARGDDASEADARVLAAQIDAATPLSSDETAASLSVDTSADVDVARVARWLMDSRTGTSR